MIQLTKDELTQFTDTLKELQTVFRQVSAKFGNNHATVTVAAGGMGVWIATTACLVMLAVNLFLGLMVIDQSRKIDDLNDYLTAIYMMAPSLKPPPGK